MIYFARAIEIENAPIKIGFSDDVDRRLDQLEWHYRTQFALLATMPGGREEEKAVHERFAHLRLGRTEQFRPAADLMAFIGRPLLTSANPDATKAIPCGAKNRQLIIHVKGSRAYATWLEDAHRKTHIAKATIVRLAIAEWAAKQGYDVLPPEL